jgi:hypothetical protein
VDAGHVDDALLASRRHWVADGLAELLVGGLELCWGAAIAAHAVWPSRLTTVLAAYLPAALGLALLVVAPSVPALLEPIKQRLTYPRLGYVKPRQPSTGRRAIGALVGMVVGMAMAAATLSGWLAGGQRWLPALLGAAFAAGFSVVAGRLGVDRFWAYALVAVAAGAVASLRFDRDLGVGAVLATVGLACAVGGALTVLRLLRLPKPAEEER